MNEHIVGLNTSLGPKKGARTDLTNNKKELLLTKKGMA
jgi:hypothetical protein